ncbi:hypothetical protein LOTGIDRAFT_165875 [Lottia gigantea]|uniref:Peptidase M12B domain-containing protein n=1 Tax=Lottia gigantea TaxID=225164 RepID=V4A4F1_LOTGI|nr:hypothetical protein LOTGIDRAFT_165875 [Lottia gigantea]ESO88136.1 hypothetical protein LOTGIDRAFT_165875 [Lottia gigantea]
MHATGFSTILISSSYFTLLLNLELSLGRIRWSGWIHQQLNCSDLSPHVTLELLLEDGVEARQSSWNRNEIMPNNLVFRIRRDHEAAVLRLTKIAPLKTIACRKGGNYPLKHTAEKGHMQIGLRLIHIEPTTDGVHEIIRQETLGQTYQDMQEEHSRHHRYKRSLRTYTIEVCLIADYQTFFKFLERNKNDSTKAEADMRNYYAFVAETIKVRFQHINEIEGTIAFNIVFSALIIIENRQDSSYTEPFQTDGDLDVGDALNATQFWLESPPSGIVLPPSDHYMFFTGYNLQKNGIDSSLGRAFTSTVCRADAYVFPDSTVRLKGSTSIVEANHIALTTLIAAHELGHALGALHDSGVGCNDTNRYIMATSSGPARNITNARHIWQFSTCSVRDMKTFVERDDVDCVNDNRYGENFTATQKSGQYYTKDTQCKILKDEDSIFCEAFYVNDKDKICYLGYCRSLTLPDGRFSCSSVMLMEYTTCDTNKISEPCVITNDCNECSIIGYVYHAVNSVIYWDEGEVDANNSAPIFVNVPTSAVEVLSNVQGVIFTAQTFDADGDTLTLHITYDPQLVSSYLSFDSITKRFSVRQGSNLADLQLNNFSLIMSVDDGLLLSLPVNVDFLIIPSKPPAFTEASYNLTVSEGEAGFIVVSTLLNRVTDPDSTQFNFKLLATTNSDYFTINSSSGRITYAKDYDYGPMRLPNNVKLSVEVKDESGLTASVDIFLTILNINQPPVFQNLPITKSVPENTAGGTSILQVTAQDPDGDTITFSLQSFVPVNQNLFIVSSAGEVRVKTGAIIDFESLPQTIYLTIAASDGEVLSKPANLTLLITNVNEPPSFNESRITFNVQEGLKNAVLVSTLLPYVTDQDSSDTFTFTIIPSQNSNYFKIDQSSGKISYAVDYDTDPERLPNIVELTIRVTDKGGLKDTIKIRLNILNKNQSPVFTNLPASRTIDVDFNSGVFFTVSVTDKDSEDTLTISLGSSAYFTFDENGNTVRFKGRQGLTATQNYQLSFRVTDGQLSTSAILTVTVVVEDTTTAVYTESSSTISLEKSSTATREQPTEQETTQSTGEQPTPQSPPVIENWEIWTIIIVIVVVFMVMVLLVLCRKLNRSKVQQNT